MRCLDATFLIDLVRGDPGARERAQAWDRSGEPLSIAAPALAEVLRGAYFRGGTSLRTLLDRLSGMEVLATDAAAAEEAGRLGAELLRRGVALATVDLLIAATAKVSQQVLVTRDRSFSQVPGLVVETY